MDPVRAPSPTSSPVLPVEAVIVTQEVLRRPARAPDPSAEHAAMMRIMRALGEVPGGSPAGARARIDAMLHTLVDALREACAAPSCGISVLEDEGGVPVVRWRAVAGVWAHHGGCAIPRDASPCGVVVARDAPIVMRSPARALPLPPVLHPIGEVLLVPFHHAGRAVGTLWLLAHDDAHRFDAEDLRLVTSLARYAALAYQLLDERRAELARQLAELRAAEEALREADRRKDLFLAMLAHELRNPLMPLRACVDVLRTPALGEDERAQAAAMMTRQLAGLVRIVDDLLDLARIKHGKIELRRERVAVSSLLACAVELARAAIDAAGHALAVEVPPGAPALEVDPVRFAQVLGNLLLNAARYTPPGGRIRLGARLVDGACELSVEDNGIGIAPELLPRVFELFAQIEGAGGRARGGLGLGLGLVKHLVELHGGAVEARSDGAGRGSRFVVRIPLAAPAGPCADGWSPRAAPAAGAARVLVVDDNPDVVAGLALILRRSGHEVHAAASGASALALARRVRPSTIVLDIGMPDMSGYELARRIREEIGAARLIALTGWGRDADRLRSSAAGIDHHLVKPVDPDALRALIA